MLKPMDVDVCGVNLSPPSHILVEIIGVLNVGGKLSKTWKLVMYVDRIHSSGVCHQHKK